MTPLDRLLAEAIPTGSFGGARPRRPAAHPISREAPAADPRAAQHCRDLLADLDRQARRRHLRVVPDAGQTTDANRKAA